MKTIRKLILASFLFCISLINAVPPKPPGGGNAGNGGNGTGEPAIPIDMYIYILGIVAMVFIIYFTRKYNKLKNIQS